MIELFSDYITIQKIWERFLSGELMESVVTRLTHRVDDSFIEIWNGSKIPKGIKILAQEKFAMMLKDPTIVELKKLSQVSDQYHEDIWQAKINDGWRALAIRRSNVLQWYWIGPRERLNNFSFPKPKGSFKGVKTGIQRPLEIR